MISSNNDSNSSLSAIGELPSYEEFCQFSRAEKISLLKNSTGSMDWIRQWKTVVMLGRPRTCIPAIFCYLLGHSYTQAPLSRRMLVGLLLSFLGSFSANLHNTYTDLPEDCENLPGRVYLVAQMGYRTLFYSLVAINVLMIALAASMGLAALLFVSSVLPLVHQYSFPPLRLKKSPLLSLWVFSLAVVAPFLLVIFIEADFVVLPAFAEIFSALLHGYTIDPATMYYAKNYTIMLLFLTFWFIAKGTFKNVPDFYGDRAAGVKTSATIFTTWKTAAIVSLITTVIAYLSLAMTVFIGKEPSRVLFALLWLVPVVVNGVQLVKAEDGTRGNQCLKIDMVISSGFIATLLLLVWPGWESVTTVVLGMAILFASDILKIDSRREQDTATL